MLKYITRTFEINYRVMSLHSYLHINKNLASENNFPCNFQLKCKYLNIRGRMSSNILRRKTHVCKARKMWSSSSSFNVNDSNVTNNVHNTIGFRQEYVNAWWSLLLHCNCVSPGLLSPTYQASNDVHVTDPYDRILGFLDRSRYFSIK
jgi:hypothetical protein